MPEHILWFREEETERCMRAKLDGGYKWITAKERLGYLNGSFGRLVDAWQGAMGGNVKSRRVASV